MVTPIGAGVPIALVEASRKNGDWFPYRRMCEMDLNKMDVDVSIAGTLVSCAAMLVFGFAVVYSIYLMRAFRWSSRESRLPREVRAPPRGCLHLRLHLLKQDPAQSAALASAAGVLLPPTVRILAAKQTPASETLLRLLEMEQTPVLAVGKGGCVFRLSHRLPLQTEYATMYKDGRDNKAVTYWEDIVADVGSIVQKVRNSVGSAAPSTVVFYAFPDVHALVDSVSFPFAVNKETLSFQGSLGTDRVAIMCFHSDSALGEEPDDSFRGTEDVSDLFIKHTGGLNDDEDADDETPVPPKWVPYYFNTPGMSPTKEPEGDGPEACEKYNKELPDPIGKWKYYQHLGGCVLDCGHRGGNRTHTSKDYKCQPTPCEELNFSQPDPNGRWSKGRSSCELYCKPGFANKDGKCEVNTRKDWGCGLIADGVMSKVDGLCTAVCDEGYVRQWYTQTCRKRCSLYPAILNGKQFESQQGTTTCDIKCDDGYGLLEGRKCVKECPRTPHGVYSIVDGICELACVQGFKNVDGYCVNSTICPSIENGTNVAQTEGDCVGNCLDPRHGIIDNKCGMCPKDDHGYSGPNKDTKLCEVTCFDPFVKKDGKCVCPQVLNGTTSPDKYGICKTECDKSYMFSKVSGKCVKSSMGFLEVDNEKECLANPPEGGKSIWDGRYCRINVDVNAGYDIGDDGSKYVCGNDITFCGDCPEIENGTSNTEYIREINKFGCVFSCNQPYTLDEANRKCVCEEPRIILKDGSCVDPPLANNYNNDSIDDFIEANFQTAINMNAAAIQQGKEQVDMLQTIVNQAQIAGTTNDQDQGNLDRTKRWLASEEFDKAAFDKVRAGVYRIGVIRNKTDLKRVMNRHRHSMACVNNRWTPGAAQYENDYQNPDPYFIGGRESHCGFISGTHMGVMDENGEPLYSPDGYTHVGANIFSSESPYSVCMGLKLPGFANSESDREKHRLVCAKELVAGDVFAFIRSVQQGKPKSAFLKGEGCCVDASRPERCEKLCLEGEDCEKVCNLPIEYAV